MSLQLEADQRFDQLLYAGQLPEDAIGSERRILGPPGTGKSTYASKYIRAAVDRYGRNGLLITSHTRTAARKLVKYSVDAGVPAKASTLHSTCYQALGKPRIADSPAMLAEWTAKHPLWPIVGKHPDPDAPAATEAAGDRALRRINTLRATMTPLDKWPPNLAGFWAAWTKWKTGERAMDYTDLIVKALKELPIAPGNPKELIGDEAQDYMPLQLALLRSWAKACHGLVLLGDDWQCLYDYAGANPRSLLYPALKPSQVRILRQSYRIPRAVHSYALRQWANRLSVGMKKEFLPRTEQGCVQRIPEGAAHAPRLIGRIEKHLANGESVALLASANFALKSSIAELRRRGIPFANHNRLEAAEWNPLGSAGLGSADRLTALCAARGRQSERLWTGRELRTWATWLEARGVFTHGGKERVMDVDADGWYGLPMLERWLLPDAYAAFLARLDHSSAAMGDWWRLRVQKPHQVDAAFAARILSIYPVSKLKEEIKLQVGTIHSFKGDEADVVFLLPDLTNRWIAHVQSGGPQRDALWRLFFVGSTRPKKILYLCDPWRRGSSIDLGRGVQ